MTKFLHLFKVYKTIIRFGFCNIQNNQGLGKGYQPRPSASADNPYLDLDNSGYHKNLIQQLFNIAFLKFVVYFSGVLYVIFNFKTAYVAENI